VLGKHSLPNGWVDGNHLFVSGDGIIFNPGQPPAPAASIIDVTTGASATVQASGFFAAALPGGL
jgi:hypothetical protein